MPGRTAYDQVFAIASVFLVLTVSSAATAVEFVPVTAYTDGSSRAPRPDLQQLDMTRGYLATVDGNEPIVSTASHAVVLAMLPRILPITNMPAMDMSPAVYTNAQLKRGGVRSTLIVGEEPSCC